MGASRKLKTILLAAASLTAASVAVAHAADRAPIERAAIEHAVSAVDHGDEAATASVTAKKLGLAGAATAALAGLMRLFGLRRVRAAAQATADFAGRVVAAGADATVTAAKAVARAASSPFRFAVVFAGLSAVGLAGVGLYDVEWIGGFAIGIAMAGLFLLGGTGLRRAFAPATKRRL